MRAATAADAAAAAAVPAAAVRGRAGVRRRSGACGCQPPCGPPGCVSRRASAPAAVRTTRFVSRRAAVPAAVVPALPLAMLLLAAELLVALAHDHLAPLGAAPSRARSRPAPPGPGPGPRHPGPAHAIRDSRASPARSATQGRPDEELGVEGRRRDRHVDHRSLVDQRRVDVVDHHEPRLVA